MKRLSPLPAAFGLILLGTGVSSAAQYRLRLDLTWDDTHPGGYPAGAHLSHLGIITHDAATSFWTVGTQASPGIAHMAVTGCIDWPCTSYAQFPSSLGDEVTPLIGSGVDNFVVVRQGFAAPGVYDILFDVSAPFPYLTFVTMIGPSPDWFVGVSGLNLRPGGAWLNSTVSPFTIYDAGIKSTKAFIFDPLGPNSNPQEPIHLLSSETDPHPLSSSTVGNYELTLIDAQTIPEPTTLILFLTGAGILLLRRPRI